LLITVPVWIAIDQFWSVPKSPPPSGNRSSIRSVHVPLTWAPLRIDSGLSGRNEPVNGGDPALTGWAALSSNVVST